jgi:hypothetical protein
MKWLLGIFLGLVSLSCLGLDLEEQNRYGLTKPTHLEVVDHYSFSAIDLNDISSRRSRTASSFQIRNKADRTSERITLSNSLFFSCRIWQSYIPVVNDQSLRLLIGKSIQVNAP